MLIIDISLPIHEKTLSWPGDPEIRVTQTVGKDESMISCLKLGSHTGTHLDAPGHFLPSGKTIDQLELSKLVGICEVVMIKKSVPEITLKDIRNIEIVPGARILFKTKNSRLLELNKFTADYTSLSLEAAQFLADRQISLVGIDYLSIESYNSPGHSVHKLLLQKEIVILEGLYLDHVPAGKYELTCLPLSLYGIDGAPCRAILRPI